MFPEDSRASDSDSAGSHRSGGRGQERSGRSGAHGPGGSPWPACDRAELSLAARCANARRAPAAALGGRGGGSPRREAEEQRRDASSRVSRPASPCEWPPAAAQDAIYLVSYPKWVRVERVVAGARHRAKRAWASSSSRSDGKGRRSEAGCEQTRNSGIVEPLINYTPSAKLNPKRRKLTSKYSKTVPFSYPIAPQKLGATPSALFGGSIPHLPGGPRRVETERVWAGRA